MPQDTQTADHAYFPDEPDRPPAGSGPPPTRRWLTPLLRRIHFYAAIFVAPFIFVVAATGAVYAFSPQIEEAVYAEELNVPASSEHLPLQEQVAAANRHVDEDVAIAAVRPAPEPGDTTRVLYHADDPAASDHSGDHRAVFVDPVTAQVRGEEMVYGTSGSLPLRTDLAQLHRHLLLGDWGRAYSELAASWLAVIVLAGVGLWTARWARTRARTGSSRRRRGLLVPRNHPRGYVRTRSWHASVGIWLALGALFLAATGITWSQYGGSNVSDLRSALNWESPSIEAQLTDDTATSADGSGDHADHADHGGSAPAESEHHDVDPAQFDTVLAAAQENGFDSDTYEIAVPSADDQAWVLRDISMTVPAPDVESIAVDTGTGEIVDSQSFDDYPFVAKLAQWGIWLHMGTLFGPVNQLLLFATAVAIMIMAGWGYRMWWQRRPTHDPHRRLGRLPDLGSLRRAPWWGKVLTVGILAGLGWFLPLLGISLAAFVALDVLLAARARRRRSPHAGRCEAIRPLGRFLRHTPRQ